MLLNFTLSRARHASVSKSHLSWNINRTVILNDHVHGYSQARLASCSTIHATYGKGVGHQVPITAGYDMPYFEESVTIALQSVCINHTVHLRFLPI